ncbi:SWIM zinc finger family protein [Pontibacter sp. E15-1]|uniref:SWIM zinc finger family protein n=1 Tax=Pontibacter sp. E15-1 TaxID=2919918 RepID=UPI001F4FDC0C|nr:SWIM zinc finger family protein [Pontibacter sp. E15-1]MCJ8165541.1 SWIM zinc finger family protein [Pontibacter sp. E15-1]
MLTLQNFETQVNSTILERGKRYYNQQAISWLEETEDNVWQAQVEGTDTYEVALTLTNKHEIAACSCDCPYEGHICKHLVAVFFAVRAETQKPTGKQQKKKAERNLFKNLLQRISLKEYQDFIQQYAARHKDFKTEFELYFADKDERIDVGKKYEELLQKLIRKHSDHGFVDYRATVGLSKEVEKLLGSGHDFISRNNFSDAFALARVVLKEMLEVQMGCDDSAGNIGGTLYEAVELIEAIATSDTAAPALKEQLFSFLKTELSNKEYFDYGDFGYELLSVFENLALQLHKPEEFIGYLDAQSARLTGQYDDYQREFLQKQKIEFLAATGKSEEAAALVQQHLDIVEVRQQEVEKALSKKDYVAAKKLINEGIRIAEDKDHPGTVATWQKELLRIAVLEKDTDTVRRYTKQFAFDRWFSDEYYTQWKATFSEQEWKGVIEKYIADTTKEITRAWKENKNKFWRPPHPPLLQTLAPIYVQEHYWDRLLALVQQEDNLTTLKYHTYLASRYPTELMRLYLPAFEQAGQEANGRSAYADLAQKMKKVMQDIPEGKEKIMAVARSLKEQYPRRPAMVEELDKILK